MKKIIQKSILIAMCYYSIALINACCHCEIQQTKLLSTDGIRVQNIEVNIEGDSIFQYKPIFKDSVALNQYGLQIQFDIKETVLSTKNHWGFINSAIACKCSSDNFATKDSLKNITIRTLQDFDATHPLGTDISSYFNAFTYVQSKLTKISIDEYLLLRSNQYYRPSFQIELYLQQSPETKIKPMQFELTCNFTNGKVFKDTTNLITLY